MYCFLYGFILRLCERGLYGCEGVLYVDYLFNRMIGCYVYVDVGWFLDVELFGIWTFFLFNLSRDFTKPNQNIIRKKKNFRGEKKFASKSPIF